MRKKLLILLLVIPVAGFAQTLKIVEGNLKPLKGEKIISTQFTYENMLIGNDGRLTEEQYINRKKTELNEKEIGRGDKWEQAWYADREARFEPQFNKLFVKYASVSTVGESKYTLIFKTTRTEPGWNVGMGPIVRAAARIDGDVWIVETLNPSNIIAKLRLVNFPGKGGMGYDFDAGFRIQEAYAKSGKEIGKLIADVK